MKIKGKQQSDRLTTQQKGSDGVIGIFGIDAQGHDKEVNNTSIITMSRLQKEYVLIETGLKLKCESKCIK